jgi:transposase InsO family protein
VSAAVPAPSLGRPKISAVLARRGLSAVPAPSTVTGILRRHGLIDPVAPPRGYVRFERDAPNQLWQMDFKGWFALRDSTRCHTLGVLDDHSRYNLVLAACRDERTATVRRHLRGAFARYGLPDGMLCDNGSPWGNDLHQPWTPLGVWLLDLGVVVVHSRPFHPQTADKEERFHLTLDWEVISTRPLWEDHLEVQGAYDRWRVVYNHQRPHEALGMAVPADRYHPSPRSLPDTIPPIDYPDGFEVRKHNGKGISYQGRQFRIPKAFRGRPLGITPTTPDGTYQVWYRHQIVTTIDLATTTHDL